MGINVKKFLYSTLMTVNGPLIYHKYFDSRSKLNFINESLYGRLMGINVNKLLSTTLMSVNGPLICH